MFHLSTQTVTRNVFNSWRVFPVRQIVGLLSGIGTFRRNTPVQTTYTHEKYLFIFTQNCLAFPERLASLEIVTIFSIAAGEPRQKGTCAWYRYDSADNNSIIQRWVASSQNKAPDDLRPGFKKGRVISEKRRDVLGGIASKQTNNRPLDGCGCDAVQAVVFLVSRIVFGKKWVWSVFFSSGVFS